MLDCYNYIYSGKEVQPTITILCDNDTLEEGADYTVSGTRSATQGGTYPLTVTGKGGYTGTTTLTYTVSYACNTPAISSIANTTSGIAVKWGAVSGASRYCVFRKVGYGNWSKLVTTSATSLTDKTVRSGITYTYTVRCVNSSGDYISAYNKAGTSLIYLLEPVVFTAANAAAGIQVKWSSVYKATSYALYRRTGTGAWKLLKKTTGTSYTDTTAVNGVIYTYTARACYGTALSAYLSEHKCLHLTAHAISSLTNVSTRKAVVKWKANAKATGYQIPYSTDKTFKSGVKLVTVKGYKTVTNTLSSLTKKRDTTSE